MQYQEITAAGTYLVKTGPGHLRGITVNLPGSTPTLAIFDNIASTTPAICGGGAAFAIPAAGTYLNYDCDFSTGLTIVIGGTSTMSYTVTYF